MGDVNQRVQVAPRDLGRLQRKLGRGAAAAMRAGLERAGRFGVASLRARTVAKGKVATVGGGIWAGWAFRITKDSVVFFNASKHFPFVEFGRKAGRMPPSTAIEQWALKRLGVAGLGFPIARAIGQRGIKPTPILNDPATKAKLRELVSREQGVALAQALREAAT